MPQQLGAAGLRLFLATDMSVYIALLWVCLPETGKQLAPHQKETLSRQGDAADRGGRVKHDPPALDQAKQQQLDSINTQMKWFLQIAPTELQLLGE